MGFSRQEYWSGLPFPSPGDLPDPGMEPMSSMLQADSLPLSHWGAQNGMSPGQQSSKFAPHTAAAWPTLVSRKREFLDPPQLRGI